jgi:ApaLI-like restriction endonuclease
MEIKEKIFQLAEKYSHTLQEKMANRVKEMEDDDKSHYLIYYVLGITEKEGEKIDIYQNKGRFLYKYAGSFLEEAAILCFQEKFPDAKKERIENTKGKKPKQFEIDCLIETDAIEIKWRDATTDGDHITKEHTRIKVIHEKGFKPIRVMFYYPNREQAIRIQETLKTIYQAVNGEYYVGESAWEYIHKKTEINLKQLLIEIVEDRRKKGE